MLEKPKLEEQPVKPVVVIGRVEYYNEAEMLKWWEVEKYGVKEVLFSQELFTEKSVFRNHWLRYCYNSIPTYLRAMEVREKELCWMGNLCKDSSYMLNGDYKNVCKQVCWGMAAYLMSHIVETPIGLSYRANRKHCEADTLCKEYEVQQYAIYRERHADDYQYADDPKMFERIKGLEEEFARDFRKTERTLLKRTKERSKNADVDEVLKEALKRVCYDVANYLRKISSCTTLHGDADSEILRKKFLDFFKNDEVTLRNYLMSIEVVNDEREVVEKLATFIKRGDTQPIDGYGATVWRVLYVNGYFSKKYRRFTDYINDALRE